MILGWYRALFAFFLGPLGLGGGGSSSSNSTATKTTNTDKRLVVDNGAVGVSADSSNVTVNALDNGAVKNAFDFATNASNNSTLTMTQALQLAKSDLKVVSQNAQLVSQSAAGVAAAYQNVGQISSGQQYLIMGVLLIGGVVAVMAIRKGK